MCVCRRTPASDDDNEGDDEKSSAPFFSRPITATSPSQLACPEDPLEHFGVAVEQRRENSVDAVAEYDNVSSVDDCAWLCIALQSSLCMGFGFSTSQGFGTCRLSTAQSESHLGVGSEGATFFFRTIFCNVGNNSLGNNALSTPSPDLPDFVLKSDMELYVGSGSNADSFSSRGNRIDVAVGCSALAVAAIILLSICVARRQQETDLDSEELESNNKDVYNHQAGLSRDTGDCTDLVPNLRKALYDIEEVPQHYSALDTKKYARAGDGSVLSHRQELPPGLRNADHDVDPAWDYASSLSPTLYQRQMSTWTPITHTGGPITIWPLVDHAHVARSQKNELDVAISKSQQGDCFGDCFPTNCDSVVSCSGEGKSQAYDCVEAWSYAPSYAEIASERSSSVHRSIASSKQSRMPACVYSSNVLGRISIPPFSQRNSQKSQAGGATQRTFKLDISLGPAYEKATSYIPAHKLQRQRSVEASEVTGQPFVGVSLDA
jgi:hypothetical protein